MTVPPGIAPAVLAIDAGQTGMKVRVHAHGRRDDLLFGGIDTQGPLLPQLAAVVRAALARTRVVPDVVSAGVSGLTDRDADAGALLALLADTGIRGATLAHDSTTSFLGALGDRHGAVVAAGTGVVTLGVGAHAVARVDGWGHIMGDAGSGYWIGRATLEAVMRAYDGRGPATALTAAVRRRWPDLPQAYMALQADEQRVPIVAGFARDVARCAAEGDPVAAGISEDAGRELARSAATALARVRTGDEPLVVCAIGGVFRSEAVRGAFAGALADGGVTLVPPRGEGIDGVVALADLAAGHPLTAGLHRAGTA